MINYHSMFNLSSGVNVSEMTGHFTLMLDTSVHTMQQTAAPFLIQHIHFGTGEMIGIFNLHTGKQFVDPYSR